MLKTHQHAITESIMFLERPRPHLLPKKTTPQYIYIYTYIYIYIYRWKEQNNYVGEK